MDEQDRPLVFVLVALEAAFNGSAMFSGPAMCSRPSRPGSQRVPLNRPSPSPGHVLAFVAANIWQSNGTAPSQDRKSVAKGKSVSVRVDPGVRRFLKKQKKKH